MQFHQIYLHPNLEDHAHAVLYLGTTATTGAVTKITKSWKPAVNDCMSLPEL